MINANVQILKKEIKNYKFNKTIKSLITFKNIIILCNTIIFFINILFLKKIIYIKPISNFRNVDIKIFFLLRQPFKYISNILTNNYFINKDTKKTLNENKKKIILIISLFIIKLIYIFTKI